MPATKTSEPHAGRVALVTGTTRGIFLLAADEVAWITGQTIIASGGNAFAL
jgi:hypothetical protein